MSATQPQTVPNHDRRLIGSWRTLAVTLVVTALLALPVGAQETPSEDQKPAKAPAIVEETGRQLVQLDFTARGAGSADIRADELELLLSSADVELDDSAVVVSSVVDPNVVGTPVVVGGGGKPVVVSSTVVVVPGSGGKPVVPPTPPISVVSVRPHADDARHSSAAILA